VQSGDGAAVIALHDLNLAARFASHALVLGGAAPVSGRVEDVMSESTLSAAFEHPLRRLRIDTRWTYIVD
jgi:iron complex transport system ATP-binding protein